MSQSDPLGISPEIGGFLGRNFRQSHPLGTITASLKTEKISGHQKNLRNPQIRLIRDLNP